MIVDSDAISRAAWRLRILEDHRELTMQSRAVEYLFSVIGEKTALVKSGTVHSKLGVRAGARTSDSE
jgi:hypothetical protein